MQYKIKVSPKVAITDTLVKICGLKEPKSLTTAIEEGADFVGFVFFEPSPRYVEINVAQYLCTYVPKSVQTVGLFVNPEDEYLAQVLHDVPLNMLQLHGDESPERVIEIKQKFGLPIMKAFPITQRSDLSKIRTYKDAADWFLFDSPPYTLLASGEKLGGMPGGNGVSFDWDILNDFTVTKPWMLAGGLTAENVGDAMKRLSPTAVDISSGVECEKGVKDPLRICSFLRAVKQA